MKRKVMLTLADPSSCQEDLCQAVGMQGRIMQDLPVKDMHLNRVHVHCVYGRSGLATGGIHALTLCIDPVIISK
jgi:hypothetical protein